MSRPACCVLAVFLLMISSAFETSGDPRHLEAKPVSIEKLDVHNVKASRVNYRDRDAMRVDDAASPSVGDADRLAIVPGASLEDGTIEIAMAGDTLPGADASARGFVGLAFRISPDRAHFECIYLRPTNGRADDQLRRNHSTQYISFPDFPWQKLRSETPGKYESYVDLVAGEWTQVKIELAGTHARLYVNNSSQPVLIVNDLKLPPTKGEIALWVGPGTLAYFSGLRITQ